MSLRTRVLLAMTVLAVVVLGGAWETVRVVEHRLVGQIDTRLDQSVPPLRPGFGGVSPFEPPGAAEQARRPGASTLFFARVDATGTVTVIGRALESGTTLPLPRLDVARARAAAADRAGAYTVSARHGGLRYRMVARGVPGSADVAVLASPLNLVDDSVSEARLIVAIVAGAALAVIALVTWWIIRLGVRPLKQMASVAVTIADDELDRRVPDAPAGTEAGDLSRAFNSMLGRLHTAAVARQETDARLRQFVGDASHELRTPVQTIRGYSELYTTGALADPAAVDDAMRRMNEESVRMSTLVDELLVLARLDQVRPIEREPVDVVHLAARRRRRRRRGAARARGACDGCRPCDRRGRRASAAPGVRERRREHAGAHSAICRDRDRRPQRRGHLPAAHGLGDRRRPRHAAGGRGPRVRALRPGRHGPDAPSRRRRPGSGHRARRGPGPRRCDRASSPTPPPGPPSPSPCPSRARRPPDRGTRRTRAVARAGPETPRPRGGPERRCRRARPSAAGDPVRRAGGVSRVPRRRRGPRRSVGPRGRA